MKACAFWIVAPGRGELREEVLPELQPEQLRIRTLFSGLSRGTEATVLAGRVPESQHETMRAPLMDGRFPFPVKYGYAAVGLTGDGRRVFVLHPHQDHFNAPAQMCIPVPDEVPSPRAVLAANMETALNIVWDAAALPGERIMVIGAGVVGLLTASLLVRIPATRVTVVDIDPARGPLAERFGCAFALPDDAPGEQELIIHASGTEAGLRLALERGDFEARIVEASWYGDRAASLPLGEAFHAQRLRLISSQVGGVSPSMRGRRSHAQRLATALSLLVDPACDSCLEPTTPFAALPQRIGALLAGGLCHVITYGSGECSV